MLSVLIGIATLIINAMSVRAEFYSEYDPVTRVVCAEYKNCPYKILNKVNSKTPEYQINLNNDRSVYTPCDGIITSEQSITTLTCEANPEFKFIYEGVSYTLESSYVNTFDKIGVVNKIELKKDMYKNFTVKILYKEKQITIKKFADIVNPNKKNGYNTGSGWKITTYYSPIPRQKRYFNGSYAADKNMNCGHGDCFDTADGTHLTQDMANTVVACGRAYKMGTQFKITLPQNQPEHPGESLTVTCHDRGGGVGNRQLDLWAGIGTKDGPPWIGEFSTRNATVEILN